jgi:hypothetical protein
MAKRNRERAKQAKRKAKVERKAQRAAGKLESPQEEILDQFGNPIDVSADLNQATEPAAGDAPESSPENQ